MSTSRDLVLVQMPQPQSSEKADSMDLDSEDAIAATTTAMIPRSIQPMPDLSLVPTLFPPPIANLITTLSTSARVSLRLSAFLIEAILETTQYSTRLSLGYTRRLLISAVSSARRVYLMSNAALEGDMLSIMGLGEDSLDPSKPSGANTTDAFLTILNKYTNLGIYIIHHTFTLAELFTMSGFYLTVNAVQSTHFAAQETVSLFDGLFGSNESSRALSSIITLVRREFLEDERFSKRNKGKATSLTALTRAMTAFACLQNATWESTSKRIKMKLIHDCTVLRKRDQAITNSGPSSTANGGHRLETHTSDGEAEAGPGPSTQSHRQLFRQPVLADKPESKSTLLEHDYSGHDQEPGTSDAMDVDEQQDPVSRLSRRRRREDIFEVTDEYTESTTVTHTLEHVTQYDSVQRPNLTSHRRMNSEPPPTTPMQPLSRVQALGSSGRVTLPDHPSPRSDLGDDWAEDDIDQAEDLASADAPAQGHSAHTARIHLVLSTMTNRILQRKRVVRRTSGDARHPLTISRRASSSESDQGHSRTPDAGPASRMLKRGVSAVSRAKSPVREHPLSLPEGRLGARKVRSGKAKARVPSRTPSPAGRYNSGVYQTQDRTPSAPPPTPLVPRSAGNSDSTASRPMSMPSAQGSRTLRPRSSSASMVDRGDDPRPRLRSEGQASSTHVHSASARVTDSHGGEDNGKIYPKDTLVKNIHRFMRFSSAAYGQNFLRIFGLGNADYNFPTTGKHHANSWSFARHTNLPIEAILLSSYVESSPAFGSHKVPPLVHYVVVDHAAEAIVLTCRGTLGLSDILIDLTCDYCPVQVEHGDPFGEYFAHSGMYQSALGLTAQNSTVHQMLNKALAQYPNYGLVVTGHSLGGGVAALLAISCATRSETFLAHNALRSQALAHPKIVTDFVTSVKSGLPPGRAIHCYAYGTPAITSPDLAEWSKGLITSVVHHTDVVPCLSLGVLRDLKNIAVTLFEEGMLAEEIVGRVIGIYPTRLPSQQGTPASAPGALVQSPPTDAEALSNWMLSLIKTMRADMDNDKLIPPGDVYIMEYFDIFVTQSSGDDSSSGSGQSAISEKQAYRVILQKCLSVQERFREPVFTKSMLGDHLPSHYERATQLLVDGVGDGGGV